jgi:hypothetical protein
MMVDDQLVASLMGSSTPSIRYLTLRRLVELAEADGAVQAQRRAMTESGPIPLILARQGQGGNWKGESSFYTPKYTSTHWSMMLLAELQADPADERLRRGAAFMLATTEKKVAEALAKREPGWECLWGNMLHYVAYAGLSDDPRAEPVIEYLCRSALESGWRCAWNWELPCGWGAARGLWGLAALPAAQRTGRVAEALAAGLHFLLDAYDPVAADYPNQGVSQMWGRLNFPLFYQADVLFVLRLAALLDALDRPGAQRALAWLQGRRNKQGRWRGASPFRSRTTLEVAPDREETDRWVTVLALAVIGERGSGFGDG